MLWLLLVGFPAFWVLGLGAFAVPMMAVPMGLELLRRRPLKLPRGFLMWALFLVWSLAGVALLGVNPYGYVPDTVSGRLIGYGTRESMYLGLTIVLLFIGNLSETELPQAKLVRWLAWSFCGVVAGGLLGLVAPTFDFTSLFEVVLPNSLRSNIFVQAQVHPRAAQVQAIFGDTTPRPAAPYPYTNQWSFNLVLLAVWFVVAVARSRSARVKLGGVLVLAAAAVTLVYSLNRAAWIAVVVGIAYAALRLARRGRLGLVLVIVLAGTSAAAVVAATPLGDVVSQRIDAGNSNQIRAFTIERAFELSAESPVVGFGSTRSTLGSASSIAVGRSAGCPTCGNAQIGMNGYLYMLLVTTGLGGVVLFAGLGVAQWWRCRRLGTPVALAGSTVLVMTAYFSPVYDAATWMLVPFVSVALLWREGQRTDGSDRPAPPRETSTRRPLLESPGMVQATRAGAIPACAPLGTRSHPRPRRKVVS
jgi:hypothetical protein